MMCNSLDRLLEGIAKTLRDDVAAQVDDPYVRAQAHAAAELIAQLAEHVEWRCDQLREEIEAASVALRLRASPAASITDNSELIRTHDALLAAVADLQKAPTETVDADAIDHFVRDYHARELDRFVAARGRVRK